MKRFFMLFAFVILVGCSPQPSPEKVSALKKQTEAANAAEDRVKTLEAERTALQEELDRERSRQAQLDREIRHVEGLKQ